MRCDVSEEEERKKKPDDDEEEDMSRSATIPPLLSSYCRPFSSDCAPNHASHRTRRLVVEGGAANWRGEVVFDPCSSGLGRVEGGGGSDGETDMQTPQMKERLLAADT